MKHMILGTATALALCAASAANAQATDRDQIRALLEQQAAAAASSGGGAQVEDTRGAGLRFKNKSVTGAPEEVVASRAPTETDAEAAKPAALGEPPVVSSDMAVNLRITFETNSAYIRPSAARLLGELCAALSDMPSDMRFNILGHADKSGSSEYNKRLSAARAQEVARHLSAECGIDSARLQTYGLGDTRLLDNAPAVSEAQRRVEVQVARGDA